MTAHSLGVVVVEDKTDTEVNSVIVRRNTPLPAEASGNYRTRFANQRNFLCKVTEGEDENLEYVRIVGASTLPLPPNLPKGSPMEITYWYDVDGMIHVRVRDLKNQTDLGEFELERTANLSEHEIELKQGQVASTVVD